MNLPPISVLPPRSEEVRAWSRGIANSRPASVSFTVAIRGARVVVDEGGEVSVQMPTAAAYETMNCDDAQAAAGFWLGLADAMEPIEGITASLPGAEI